MVKMWKGINWKEIFNNQNEIHAFELGVSEVICPMKARFPMPMKYENPLEEEYHYYMVGRVFGILFWLVIIIGGIIWLK